MDSAVSDIWFVSVSATSSELRAYKLGVAPDVQSIPVTVGLWPTLRDDGRLVLQDVEVEQGRCTIRTRRVELDRNGQLSVRPDRLIELPRQVERLEQLSSVIFGPHGEIVVVDHRASGIWFHKSEAGWQRLGVDVVDVGHSDHEICLDGSGALHCFSWRDGRWGALHPVRYSVYAIRTNQVDLSVGWKRIGQMTRLRFALSRLRHNRMICAGLRDGVVAVTYEWWLMEDESDYAMIVIRPGHAASTIRRRAFPTFCVPQTGENALVELSSDGAVRKLPNSSSIWQVSDISAQFQHKFGSDPFWKNPDFCGVWALGSQLVVLVRNRWPNSVEDGEQRKCSFLLLYYPRETDEPRLLYKFEAEAGFRFRGLTTCAFSSLVPESDSAGTTGAG